MMQYTGGGLVKHISLSLWMKSYSWNFDKEYVASMLHKGNLRLE